MVPMVNRGGGGGGDSGAGVLSRWKTVLVHLRRKGKEGRKERGDVLMEWRMGMRVGL
jgi:hypothetical protein